MRGSDKLGYSVHVIGIIIWARKGILSFI